jgi:outer membrane protein assembly factor BamB
MNESTPTVISSRPSTPLIIGTNGYVVAFERTSGRELWRTKLQSGVFTSTGGNDVAVLTADTFVFAGAAGHLFCLSLTDGQIVWHNELPGLGHNDVALAIDSVSIQYLQKVVRTNSPAGSST